MAAMRVLVIACSLNDQSRSAVLADRAAADLVAEGLDLQRLDLRELDLPLCDAGRAYAAPAVQRVAEAVTEADAVLLAVPIYNYDVSAAAKNMVELTGKAWTGKVVGFLCAAGGRGSFMSVMGLANSLMLDFRCLVVPRFVYATAEDFDENGAPVQAVDARVRTLCGELHRVGAALMKTAAAAPASD